jgi:hypothetical protein
MSANTADLLNRVLALALDDTATADTKETALNGLLAQVDTEQEAFALWWAVTVIGCDALRSVRPASDDGKPWGIQFVNASTGTTGADDAPPAVRLVGRWLTAGMNADLDNAAALWKTIADEQTAQVFVTTVWRFTVSNLRLQRAAVAKGGDQ